MDQSSPNQNTNLSNSTQDVLSSGFRSPKCQKVRCRLLFMPPDMPLPKASNANDVDTSYGDHQVLSDVFHTTRSDISIGQNQSQPKCSMVSCEEKTSMSSSCLSVQQNSSQRLTIMPVDVSSLQDFNAIDDFSRNHAYRKRKAYTYMNKTTVDLSLPSTSVTPDVYKKHKICAHVPNPVEFPHKELSAPTATHKKHKAIMFFGTDKDVLTPSLGTRHRLVYQEMCFQEMASRKWLSGNGF